jgi:hypothetical protein
MLNDLKNIKSGKAELREFGVTMAAILVVIGDIALWRQRPTAVYLIGLGAALGVLGLFKPDILKPLQKAWMGLGLVLGFFVSRVVMSVLFYLIMTPIGVIMRLSGKDILDEKIDRNRSSYWHELPTARKPKESYENQY